MVRSKGEMHAMKKPGSSEKKDLFNGYIAEGHVGDAIVTIVFFTAICIGSGIFSLWGGLFYEKVKPDDRIVFCMFGIIVCLIGIYYSAGAIYFIRRSDKYPRLAKSFFKPYMYK